MERPKYIKGVFLNKRENAPDFVIGTVSIKVEDFFESCKDWVNDKGYVNIDILNGRDGVPYLKPNDYGVRNAEDTTKKKGVNPNTLQDAGSLYDLAVKATKDEIDISDIPF